MRLSDQQNVSNTEFAKQIVDECADKGGFSRAGWSLENADGAPLHQVLKCIYLSGIQALLWSVVQGIRQVKAVIIDDANAMGVVRGRDNPSDFLQPWVTAAESAGVKLIVVGTPGMAVLWDGEGEIHRRAQTVYVYRYLLESEGDRKAFTSLLLNLTSTSQWEGFDVRKHAGEIYHVTFGVYGQVKALLSRAESAALGRGSSKVSLDDLRSCFPNPYELRRMAERSAEFDALSAPSSISDGNSIYAEVFKGRAAKSSPGGRR